MSSNMSVTGVASQVEQSATCSTPPFAGGRKRPNIPRQKVDPKLCEAGEFMIVRREDGTTTIKRVN
jgi:hypothetical protein